MEDYNAKVKEKLLSINPDIFLPNISIDNVILGFHDGNVKILLNKFKAYSRWMLPGGFILRNEDVDLAAYRILRDRTGLDKIYLTQFHSFGNLDRTNIEENRNILSKTIGLGDSAPITNWFAQRFISIGYYALIEYSKVCIQTSIDEDVKWFEIDDIPQLYSDHNLIIKKALATIRAQVGSIPIGYELLSDKFTMSELRAIYETIYNKKLDRRNFQRKMLSTGLLYKLGEITKKKGVKPSSLFSFNKAEYDRIFNNGVFSAFD